jgi:ankyrin repeat protein
VSKTRLFKALKALDVAAVGALLAADPALVRATDDRRRNPLHFLCSLPADRGKTARALTLARRLLEAGIDVDAPAFVEGGFRATPLWYAIARGGNLELARFLLDRGSTPEHCLWAAAFAENVEAIDLLVRRGASLDPVAEDETPFLGAIKWSRFVSAERLLQHGADVNFQNSKGLTALHLVLRKNSHRRHVEMLLRHHADPTIRSRDGKTPLDLVARRRDRTWHDLLARAVARPARASPLS